MIALLLCLSALAREVTLDEALDLALQGNPQVRVAELAGQAATAQARQVRSYFLPTVTLSGAALWWDAPLEAEIVSADACADMDAAFQSLCEQFVGGFAEEPILLREQATQLFTAEAKQPLTGLWAVAEGHRATRLLARAARLDADQQRSATAVDVVEAWLAGLRTRELERVAERAVQAIEAHGARARAFHEAGIIGNNDVLQLEVALADARLALRRVRAGLALADRALALVTGAPDRTLEPVPIGTDALPAFSPQGTEALAQARPDVAALEARLEAARANLQAKRADLLPQVAGVAKWSRTWGVGDLAAAEEAYVGLGFEWDVWGWGRRAYAVQEAALQARQAEVGLAALRDGAVLQAEAALSDADTARAAWEAGQVSARQAQENLRIVQARFEAHTLTSADLLEAETLYTKAQADVVGAFYDYLLAVARARDALGLPVRPLDDLDAGRP